MRGRDGRRPPRSPAAEHGRNPRRRLAALPGRPAAAAGANRAIRVAGRGRRPVAGGGPAAGGWLGAGPAAGPGRAAVPPDRAGRGRHPLRALLVVASRVGFFLFAALNLHLFLRFFLWAAEDLGGFDVALARVLCSLGNGPYVIGLLGLAWWLLAPYAEAVNYLF